MSGISLRTNVNAERARRQLERATDSVAESTSRLSSGQRINRASDDAAGLSVLSNLNIRKGVYLQGVRNLNDGISYLNVVEGGLTQLVDITTRIQELAAQGANGSLGSSQRKSLQKEVDSLQEEYNRIIGSTKFNGSNVLNGSSTRVVLQGGFGGETSLRVQVGAQVDLTTATTRQSTSSAGAQSDGLSDGASISADGRYVVFDSDATNLVAGDTNGVRDVYLKDTTTGQITRVSVGAGGVQGDGSSSRGQISADGRFVTFISSATNLVAGDTNGVSDAFVYDIQAGTTKRVSVSSSGVQGDGFSAYATISADGRYVSYTSRATNLVSGDTNAADDIFVFDSVTSTTTRASLANNGAEGNAYAVYSRISSDGRYVAFSSSASNLVTGDSNGVDDIFVRDLTTGTTRRVSETTAGVGAAGASFLQAMSADGRYVLFSSPSNNLAAGTSGTQLYRKDLETQELKLVSTDASGNAVSGQTYLGGNMSSDGRYVAVIYSVHPNGAFPFWRAYRKDVSTGAYDAITVDQQGSLSLSTPIDVDFSADGRKVAFSAGGLNYVSGDTNSVPDLFVRDMSVDGVQELAGMLVSTAQSSRITLDLSRQRLAELSSHLQSVAVSSSRARSFANNLQSTSDRYAEAADRISSVDIAAETADYARSKILQEASAAILAQSSLSTSKIAELLF